MEQEIKDFFYMCINGQRPIASAVQPESKDEFWAAHAQIAKSQEYARKEYGIPSRLTGSGDILKNGFDVLVGTRNEHRLMILAPSTKPVYKKKGVSDTSLEAYASLDKATQIASVCAIVVKLHARFPYVSDTLVAREAGLPEGRISARRGNVETAGGVLVDGTMYRLEYSTKKEPCPVTGNRVQMWRLVTDQLPSVAVQTSLFSL